MIFYSILYITGINCGRIVKISPQIHRDTGWYNSYQLAYDVYNFYKSKKGYIDLYGNDGASLRTMCASDYFCIVSLDKKRVKEEDSQIQINMPNKFLAINFIILLLLGEWFSPPKYYPEPPCSLNLNSDSDLDVEDIYDYWE